MILKSLKNIQKPFGNCFLFCSHYENKKAQMFRAKTNQSFKPNLNALISQNIMIDQLVPNFFTNQLTLQTYPDIPTPNRNINYFLNSYTRINLPLASNAKLRQKLNKLFDNQVRIGRIFELMDSIAGIVSYSHCFGGYTPGTQSNSMVCVTGSVESLHLFDKIDIRKDLTMQGYLNHVGRTSMEIEINVIQEDRIRANSLFTMIARNAKNQNQGYQVPALSFQHLPKEEYEKALDRQQNAKLNVIQRKQELKNSYDKKPPTAEQILDIHNLHLSRKINRDQSCPISQTKMEISEVMHTQRRNMHGKIFGGFLIKQMIELGWGAACRHAGDFVIIQDLTNIYFKKPVDIGCRLTLKAMVTLIEDKRVVITVEAYTSKFTSKEETLACYLHLIAKSRNTMKKVYPESYEESLQYLSSKKAFKQLFY